ncbi:galactose oxidase early set domain-containing protein [Nocardia salmonicida]|uniref:galactose oxidase early set domain-containing protein n=1 Tax=Nocardia salmonicida TaxID=53431 RepID=UPI0034247490
MPWDPNVIDSEILAVHAAYLNYGKIVFFGGSQHDPVLHLQGKIDSVRVFDCNSYQVVSRGPKSPLPDSRPLTSFGLFDVFCCGHALSINGTLLIAGGTEAYDADAGYHTSHFPGLRDAAVFRYDDVYGHGPEFANSQVEDMNRGVTLRGVSGGDTGGRWYPTLLTLGNGDVLAISGHPAKDDREHANFIPEIFTPGPGFNGAWTRLGSYASVNDVKHYQQIDCTYYPRVHLLPTGEILFVSPVPGNKTVKMTLTENPAYANFVDVCHFDPNPESAINPEAYKDPKEKQKARFLRDDENRQINRYAGISETSVLLPLAHDAVNAHDDVVGYQRARILIAGAEDSWILDLTPGVDPQWEKTGPRKKHGKQDHPTPPRRMNGLAVILPTGEIFFTGGVDGELRESTDPEFGLTRHDWATPDQVHPPAPAYGQTPEVFNTEHDFWVVLDEPENQARRVRNYHSVALLMPDGAVWVSGSDHDAGRGFLAAERSIEIFYPWYYHREERPEILDTPDRWRTGSTFVIRSSQAQQIKKVVMVRCGSVTHGFNSDQRHLSVKFQHAGGDHLEVVAPPNGWVAPSGLYFLYTINELGLPSKGVTVHVLNEPLTEAEQQWDFLFAGE